ncbi:MAG: BglII/BstYI family type II restriction endonuclease [Bacteroidota bacterium]|nr:BglII/BstYI family type II restriction endonuclease [Bacteroidota bacterium]
MIIAQEYNHLNAKEFLLIHHKSTYQEILDVIKRIDVEKHRTKVSKEKTMVGEMLYSPGEINLEIKTKLEKLGWKDTRRDFYVSTDPNIVKQLEPLDFAAQKILLNKLGLPLYDSYNQTDLVKNKIALEIQFGKYFAVTYDLFVKHLSFYNGQIIDVGIEVVPTKKMLQQMSTGVPWFEKEVHNVLRHGRTNPPVPILMLGIEADPQKAKTRSAKK